MSCVGQFVICLKCEEWWICIFDKVRFNVFETFLSRQLSTIDFYILNRSITSHNKKSLQKLLNKQQKKLSSLTRNCSLPTFTITNLTRYELSQEESDLPIASLYFSIHPDKIRKSEIFSIFEKIHYSFINNLKSEEIRIR